MVDPDIFNDVPLFALLDADERKVLAHQVSARNFAQGETIFRVGEPGNYAYLIQRGKVNVCITDLADEVIVVEVAEAGGLLGMSSLLAHANHLTTATAVEDTSAIEIDRGDISTLLQQRPLAGLDMMTMIETQLRATQESVGEFANLEARRLGIQIAFALMFAVIALIVLLSSAWIGLDFANRLVAPIRRLIGAAKVVSTGNLHIQVPVHRSEGDLAQLGDTFNKMTHELR
jgi:nitrogen fixation/metabolism regulation signal transduction histidine kinase